MMCRFHVQTAGSSLTAQSIDNNVVRTTIQALAAVLGGAQSLHTNSRDEALALPTEEAARLALRTQQILAYEAGVTETPDPLAGSYYVETLTDELEAAANAYLDEIEAMGGALAAIEAGYQQRQIQEAAYAVQRRIESGEQVVVGVNRFVDDAVASPPLQRIDPEAEREQVERVRRVRAERDAAACERALAALGEAAAGTRQPAAADHRRGQGAGHAGRDQRPAARGLGRAPRADHRLSAGRPWRPADRQRTCTTCGAYDAAMTPPPAAARLANDHRLGKVHHVAIVVRDLDAALGFYRDILGLAVELVEPIPHDRVTIAFLPVGESKLELVMPTDESTGVARFLASKGEGFHHVCFEVPDIADTLTRLAIEGVELIDTVPRKGAEGPVAFLHPRSCHGVLVELIEAPGGPAWKALGY